MYAPHDGLCRNTLPYLVAKLSGVQQVRCISLRQPMTALNHLASFLFHSELGCRVHGVDAYAEQQGPEDLFQGRDDAGMPRLVFGSALRRQLHNCHLPTGIDQVGAAAVVVHDEKDGFAGDGTYPRKKHLLPPQANDARVRPRVGLAEVLDGRLSEPEAPRVLGVADHSQRQLRAAGVDRHVQRHAVLVCHTFHSTHQAPLLARCSGRAAGQHLVMEISPVALDDALRVVLRNRLADLAEFVVDGCIVDAPRLAVQLLGLEGVAADELLRPTLGGGKSVEPFPFCRW